MVTPQGALNRGHALASKNTRRPWMWGASVDSTPGAGQWCLLSLDTFLIVAIVASVPLYFDSCVGALFLVRASTIGSGLKGYWRFPLVDTRLRPPCFSGGDASWAATRRRAS
jgi:hypothetical protein